jgi:hypothetical protein
VGDFWGAPRASRTVLVLALLVASRAHAQSTEAVGEALPPPPPPPSAEPSQASPAAPLVAPSASAPSAAELPPSEPVRRPALERQPLSSVGERLVYVRIHAGDRPFSVVTPKDEQPIAVCDGECGFWAWPGNYSVRLQLDGAPKESGLSLRIRKPGRYDLIPADRAARNTGLVLGLVGPVISFVGVLMTVAGVLEAGCTYDTSQDDCHDDGPAPIAYYGLATLAVGAGMTTAGWIVFAHNRVHFQLSDDPGPLGTSARVSVLPMPHGGLGLGALVAF